MKQVFGQLGTAVLAIGLIQAVPALAAPSLEQQADHRIKRADIDGNGSISLAEFLAERQKTAAAKPDWGPEMTDPAKVERAFNRFDSDGNGEITRAELIAELKAREAKSS